MRHGRYLNNAHDLRAYLQQVLQQLPHTHEASQAHEVVPQQQSQAVVEHEHLPTLQQLHESFI